MSELCVARHIQASFGADSYGQFTDLRRKQTCWLGDYMRMPRDIN